MNPHKIVIDFINSRESYNNRDIKKILFPDGFGVYQNRVRMLLYKLRKLKYIEGYRVVKRLKEIPDDIMSFYETQIVINVMCNGRYGVVCDNGAKKYISFESDVKEENIKMFANCNEALKLVDKIKEKAKVEYSFKIGSYGRYCISKKTRDSISKKKIW